MKVNHFIYQWEREAVRLRYDEGLIRQQIADRLGLRFAQVKYIFSKVNVKHFIQTKVKPSIWKAELQEIDERLSDPVAGYDQSLIEHTEAQTYQWFGPGQKHYYPDNRKRLRAVAKIGRLLGVTGDQTAIRRDLRKAIHRYACDLSKRRDNLLKQLALVPQK